MNLSNLTDAQQSAVQRALEYWVSRWDWESPLLFGRQRSEIQEMLSSWPECWINDECEISHAVLCAFSELLHGGSTPSESSLQAAIGLRQSEAAALLARLRSELSASAAKSRAA
jgi:hypothetical protein